MNADHKRLAEPSLPPPPLTPEDRKKYIEEQIDVIHSPENKFYTFLEVQHEPTEEELRWHYINFGGAKNYCVRKWRELWNSGQNAITDKWTEFWKYEYAMRKAKKNRRRMERAN